MVFTAQSRSDEGFREWVEEVKRSGKELNQTIYEALVEPSEYVPVSYYVLTDPDLFDQIITKYKAPEKKL